MPAKDYHLDKFHIINSTESVVEDILRFCKSMDDEFFFKGNGKWSPAENLEHLRLSFYKSWQGLFIPKFISRIIFKKPQSTSLPYEVLQEKYEQLLSNGAKATKEYIPDFSKKKRTKDQVIEEFRSTFNRYLNEVRYYWEEKTMESYQFPHPLLGLITARELMYFNLFHCWHHFRILRRRNGATIEL